MGSVTQVKMKKYFQTDQKKEKKKGKTSIKVREGESIVELSLGCANVALAGWVVEGQTCCFSSLFYQTSLEQDSSQRCAFAVIEHVSSCFQHLKSNKG